MELLTGKCKEDFEKWLREQDYGDTDGFESRIVIKNHLTPFSYYPLSMQFGVYQDFFGDVEIDLGNDSKNSFWVFTENEKYFDSRERSYIDIDRLTSRSEAIKKANEIYNELNK